MPTRYRFFSAATVVAAVLMAPLAAHSFEVLDNMIFGAKCLNAEDKEACKAKAIAEANAKERELYGNQRGDSTPSAATEPATSNQSVMDNVETHCETYKASGPLPVDDAYNRVMDRYELTTPEEIQELKARTDSYRPPKKHKHIRVPGVRYELTDRIFMPGFSKGEVFLDLRIAKQSSVSGTNLRVDVCVNSMDYDQRTYLDSQGRSHFRPPYNNPYFKDPAFWKAMSTEFRQFVK